MAGTITPTLVQHRSRGLVRLDVTILTDASGDASLTTLPGLYGKVVGVFYDAGTLATGADTTITDLTTGKSVLVLTDAGTADRIIRPSVNVSLLDGANVAAATTSTDVYKDLFVFGKLQIVTAQGGNTLTGKVSIIVAESAI